jgi:hypothetical protein
MIGQLVADPGFEGLWLLIIRAKFENYRVNSCRELSSCWKLSSTSPKKGCFISLWDKVSAARICVVSLVVQERMLLSKGGGEREKGGKGEGVWFGLGENADCGMKRKLILYGFIG